MSNKIRRLRPVPYMWMSFADDGKALGVIIIQARDIREALRITHNMGINPGGQVLSFPWHLDAPPPKEVVGKLMSKADLQRLLPELNVKSMREFKNES